MPSPQRTTPQSSESSSREQALLLTKHSYKHMSKVTVHDPSWWVLTGSLRVRQASDGWRRAQWCWRTAGSSASTNLTR